MTETPSPRKARAARAKAGAEARPREGGGAETEPAQAGTPAPASATDFREIVLQYETPLLRYLRHLAEPDDAEDIAQEAFIRLHDAMRRPAGVRNCGAFLFRAAHNLALDHRRRRKARQALRDRAARDLPPAVNGAEDDENSPEGLAALVRRAACEKALEELRKLPGRRRRVLLLKVVQDFTLREIAQITGLTVGNAAYHLSAGLKDLARRLKAAGVI